MESEVCYDCAGDGGVYKYKLHCSIIVGSSGGGGGSSNNNNGNNNCFYY